jgi:polyisoprenoid-binding protein YceI
MDRLMHDALMVDEHPGITYELTSAEPAGATATDGTFVLNTTGELSLTGTTRDVQIDVTGTRLADGKIRFTGSHAMKMSDYGMAAPTAMFGQLRTGDDITIHFDIVAGPAE